MYLAAFLLGWILSEASADGIIDVRRTALTGAHGMEIDSSGDILLSDTFGAMGQEESGVYRLLLKGGLHATAVRGAGLSGLSRSKRGYLICDLKGSRVTEWDNTALEPLRQWTVSQPWNAKEDSEGRIYAVTYGGALVQLQPDGETKLLLSGLDAPFDLAFGQGKGAELWISEQGIAEGRVSLWDLASGPKPQRTPTRAG